MTKLLDPNVALVAPAAHPERKKGPIIHRTKLFGGRQTAQEVHAQHGFPLWAKCAGCSCSKGLQTRVVILVPLDKMRNFDPLFDELMAVNPQQFMEILVKTKYGNMVRLSTTYACPSCTPALERTVAKLPDWAIVDINRGPGADKIVSGPS